MQKKYRPKWNPKRDKNHFVPLRACQMWGGGFNKKPNEFGVWRGFIRGLHAELHDTSKAGGEMLDWIFILADVVMFVEVKVEREVIDETRQTLTDNQYYVGELKPGERSFYYNSSALKVIVSTEEEFWERVLVLVDYVLARDSMPMFPEYNAVYFQKMKDAFSEE